MRKYSPPGYVTQTTRVALHRKEAFGERVDQCWSKLRKNLLVFLSFIEPRAVNETVSSRKKAKRDKTRLSRSCLVL